MNINIKVDGSGTIESIINREWTPCVVKTTYLI